MISKFILKLIDLAILPSLLVFASKFLGIFIVLNLTKVSYEIGSSGIIFKSLEDFYRINSLSNIPFIIFVFSGLFLALSRVYFLSSFSISPYISGKIANLGLEGLLVPPWKGYMLVAIWAIISIIVTLSLFTQFLLGLAPVMQFATSLALLFLFFFLTVLLLERDLRDVFSTNESILIIEEDMSA